jgi:hypothetical protein
MPPVANHVEVMLWRKRLPGGVYDTSLDAAAFQAVIRRAALARLRPATEELFKSYHYRDMVLENRGGELRAARRQLLTSTEAADAPLLEHAYVRDTPPVTSFSSGWHLHDVRHVRRLALRLPAQPPGCRVDVMLETYSNCDGALVRRVWVQASLDPRAQPAHVERALEAARSTARAVVLGRGPP